MGFGMLRFFSCVVYHPAYVAFVNVKRRARWVYAFFAEDDLLFEVCNRAYPCVIANDAFAYRGPGFHDAVGAYDRWTVNLGAVSNGRAISNINGEG